MVPAIETGQGSRGAQKESLWGRQDKGREGSARAEGAKQKQHHNKDTNVCISYLYECIRNP